jgi:protease-4
MYEDRPSLPVRLWRATWNTVDGARRLTVNLLFLLLVAVLLAAALASGPKVPAKAALVVAPEGVLVEELTGSPVDRARAKLLGDAPRETLLRDVLAGIRAAKDDERIAVLVLDLDQLERAGMTKLRDVAAAIGELRAAGKRVVATGDNYSQAAYYLAAHADEIHLSPQGLLLLEGFGLFRPYYREGLDKFGVNVHVFRVGEFKSAVEPYLRDGISPEARESYLDVLGDLWSSYLAEVAAARKLTVEEMQTGIEQLPERLTAAAGDAAGMVLAGRLVDHLSNRDEVRARLIELVGEDEEKKSFSRISLADYLKAQGLAGPAKPSGEDAVGVVMAAGTILDGEQASGKVGGDSTAALVRQAREDDKVKAVVLRVDSPGGSAFASEVIRRELLLTREAGKPVVVSMGSLAASGGYWIATASDQIWADPTTITGSIGIFGMIPTFERPLAEYLGVRVDGVGTTWLAGSLRLDRALDPRLGGVIQQLIDRGYEDFLARVGEARKMERDAVDRIARGRIWSGRDAKELGLVDELGGLEPAIAAARTLAKLEADAPVRWIERETSWKEQLAADLFSAAARLAPAAERPSGPLSTAARLRAAVAELEALAELDDPQGLLAHCLCEIDG